MDIYVSSKQLTKVVNKFLSMYFDKNVHHKYHRNYPNFIFFFDDKKTLVMVYDGNTQIIYLDIALSYDYGNKLNLHPNNFYLLQREWVKKNFIEPVKNVEVPSIQKHMEWRKLFEGE